MAVRMKDIARDLDVSAVTVSKVLLNHGDIGPQTRQRVLQRAAKMVLELIGGQAKNETREIRLRPTLVVRESTTVVCQTTK
jgi:DNA-binding LacI/PurR family transcriptional regulator